MFTENEVLYTILYYTNIPICNQHFRITDFLGVKLG